MLLNQKLEEIGLSEKESKIYLAMLELGPSPILSISKHSGIKRSTVYEVMDSLQSKNLIASSKKGKRLQFVAAEPEKIMNLLEEKQRLFTSLLPELNAVNNIHATKPKVMFYEGLENLKRVYEDKFSSQTEIIGFASSHALNELKEFTLNYQEKRVKAEIRVRLVAPDVEFLKKYFSQNRKEHLREYKLIDKKKYPFSVEVNIYDNKISLISFKERTAMIIESPEMYKTWKMIFELVWGLL